MGKWLDEHIKRVRRKVRGRFVRWLTLMSILKANISLHGSLNSFF